MSKCCVVGLGYIGLPTSALLASAGHNVTGFDVNPTVVTSVNSGTPHIHETGLPELLEHAVASGTLIAQQQPSFADIFIVTVPTPTKLGPQGIPQADISYVLDAANSIAPYLKPGNLVILESTSPVGTTDSFLSVLLSVSGLSCDDIFVAYCPERVIPGRILEELVTNDRVIGGVTPLASEVCSDFYATFCHGQLFKTSSRTAELVKLTENSYRDVNIAFANELSLVCANLNINVRELIELANRHPRVNVLQPGCGVGGHCIAVDPWFIASAAPDITPLIQCARHVNDGKSRWVIDQIHSRASDLEVELGRPVRIGCLGITFKPDVDDLRESPALNITTQLLVSGFDIYACEPNLVNHPTVKLYPLDYVLAHADLLVFLVAHTPFKGLDLTGRSVFDLVGVTELVQDNII